MAIAIELDHVCHDHPLVLNEDFDSSSIAAPIVCCICDTPIIGLSAAYTCSLQHSPCSFFLHKRCAESPQRVIHHMHSQHQLDLCYDNFYFGKVKGKFSPEFVKISCAVCTGQINKNSAKCVVMESVLDHEGHQHHSLPLLRRTACFSCDACGIKSEEFGSYICHSCHFWIHSSCALYPRTIRLRIHEDDTLQLIYSIPEMYRRFIRHCPICSQGLEQKYWAYFCEEFGYFVHIKCAAALLASGKNMIEIADDDEQTFSNLMQFPLPRTESLMENIIAVDRSGNLSPQRNAIEDEIDNSEESPLINHWSYPEHKLFLLEELENAHNSEDDDDDDNDEDEAIRLAAEKKKMRH
ncbi:uncharacterized protein LOC108214815 [Daucus carota subsp. sativus]|uniref:uncharacterized protein LOC108214815 n=1 Tax=Daucus carota subsp. sativus TaxID=79200 RepID=UPI0007EF1428|nr:PREDICTED: uncharacterized protein LOC108214815 isoform X1 [Daucus carota subsp. sativus]XP_017242508.1 PREDICTED: uncharacterized protein LOC108214815 isoform X2 [Daucus carota subsp. sativus]